MTARSLKGNFSGFGAYFGYKLRSLRTLIILNSIFALLSYPAVVCAALPFANSSIRLEEYRSSQVDYWKLEEYSRLESINELYLALLTASAVICALMLVAMFIMSYAVTAKAYRWLYDKTVVDMDYSLPVSDDTRFFGDLLASVTGGMLPHALAIAVGAGMFWLLPFGNADRAEVNMIWTILVQLAVTGFAASIMFMGTTLLVMALCGRKLEARIMPFVMNGVVTVVHLACILLMTQGMYGYNSGGDFEFSGIAATSPLGLLIYTMIGLDNTIYEYGDAVFFRPGVGIPAIIFTLLFFAGAYFLIKRRRAERVGSPYAFSAVKYMIPSAVIFTIVLVFSLVALPRNGNLGSASLSEIVGIGVVVVIISLIVYIIMELISGKGFRSFHKTLGRYAITLAASAVVCLGIYSFGDVIFARYTPRAANVESMRFYIYSEPLEQNFNYIETTDEAAIENMIEVHKHLINKGEDSLTDNYLRVYYYLENGSSVSRNYYLSDAESVNAVEKIFTPGCYFDYMFTDNFDVPLYHARENDAENIIEWIAVDGSWVELNMPLSELEKAFREDCELAGTDKMFDSDGGYTIKLRVNSVVDTGDDQGIIASSSHSFFVQPWCENTVALLERYTGDNILDGESSGSMFVMYKIPSNEFAPVDGLWIDYSSGCEMGYTLQGSEELYPIPAGWNYMMPLEPDSYMLELELNGTFDEDYEQPYVYLIASFEDMDKEGLNRISIADSAKMVNENWYYEAEWRFEDMK